LTAATTETIAAKQRATLSVMANGSGETRPLIALATI
jgi:hypothetical protein